MGPAQNCLSLCSARRTGSDHTCRRQWASTISQRIGTPLASHNSYSSIPGALDREPTELPAYRTCIRPILKEGSSTAGCHHLSRVIASSSRHKDVTTQFKTL